MKKLFSLGLLIAAFFVMAPQAQAQTEAQQKIWDQAKQQTELLGEKISMEDNQKAYITRHLYNYQENLNALEQNVENLPFSSKEELLARLNQEVQNVLSADQYETFKSVRSELLEVKSE